jgi:hypothetical protein
MKQIIRSIALIALAVSPFLQSTWAQVLSGDNAASTHVRSNYPHEADDMVGKNKIETAQLGHSSNAPFQQVRLTTNAHPALLGGISPSRPLDDITLQRVAWVIIRGLPFFLGIP